MGVSENPNTHVQPRKSNKKIFFSIKPSPNVGVAHQLGYFNVFYKLGVYLGFEYLHVPFSSGRSSKTVYKFLGFNRHFNKSGYIFSNTMIVKVKTLLLSCKYKTIDLNFNAAAVSRASLNNFEELVEYVQTATSCVSKRPLLVNFSGKTGDIYRWVHTNIGCSGPTVNLRSSYFAARDQNPWPSRYQPDSIKILVHIRQGDTALISTPWQTIIDTKYMRETESINLAEGKFTSTEDYLGFIKLLIKYINPQNYSIVVCSDGYQRGFRKIYQNKASLGLTASKEKQLKLLEENFESKKFSEFNTLPNCVTVIGESDPNLYDLIHSAMSADLIIFGDQQKMMPRLMESYADQVSPPVFLHLRNTENIKGLGDVGLDSANIKLTSINLRNYKADMVEQICKDLIHKREHIQNIQ